MKLTKFFILMFVLFTFSSGLLGISNGKDKNLWPKDHGELYWDVEDEWFVDQWLARMSLSLNFYGSYGRENLQWGPSYLFSPSNPFFTANFKTNPLNELPGLDFARIIWMLNPTWSFSLIANVGEGRVVFPLGLVVFPGFPLRLNVVYPQCPQAHLS